MKIANRTPHPLTILPAGSSDPSDGVAIQPEGRDGIARVRTTHRVVDTLRLARVDARPTNPLASGAPPSVVPDVELDVVSTQWGEVVGVDRGPQVVSVVVAAALIAAGRDVSEVYVPADQVRDDKGRIVGCRGLVRAVDAMPRLGPPPQVVVFGSAARWVLTRDGDSRDAAERGLTAPRDLDVGYCGMDPRTAERIALDWLRRQPSLRGGLELDLRYLRPEEGGLVVPRPAALPGERAVPGVHDAPPLDAWAVPIFGSRAVHWVDSRDLPARVRRAERLLQLGVHSKDVECWLADVLRQRHVLVLADEAPATAFHGDAYDAPTLGALRRAVARLTADAGGAGVWARACGSCMHGALLLRLAEPEPGSGDTVDRLRSLVCPPGSAASSAPEWQRRAGRLIIGEGRVGSEYGATFVDPRSFVADEA